jgi:hypothetical protein
MSNIWREVWWWTYFFGLNSMNDFEHVFLQVSEGKLRIFVNYYRRNFMGANDSRLQTVSYLINKNYGILI